MKIEELVNDLAFHRKRSRMKKYHQAYYSGTYGIDNCKYCIRLLCDGQDITYEKLFGDL